MSNIGQFFVVYVVRLVLYLRTGLRSVICIYIYEYKIKASGVHLGRLTLPHGESEAYLDRLASTEQVSNAKQIS